MVKLISVLLFFVGIVFTLLFISCNQKTKAILKSENQTNSELEKLAVKNFQNSFELSYNHSKDFVLISKAYSTKTNDAFPSLRLELVQLKPFESLFTDVVRGGKAIWEEDYILKVDGIGGIPNPNNASQSSNTYRYHALNRKKYSKGIFQAKK